MKASNFNTYYENIELDWWECHLDFKVRWAVVGRIWGFLYVFTRNFVNSGISQSVSCVVHKNSLTLPIKAFLIWQWQLKHRPNFGAKMLESMVPYTEEVADYCDPFYCGDEALGCSCHIVLILRPANYNVMIGHRSYEYNLQWI